MLPLLQLSDDWYTTPVMQQVSKLSNSWLCKKKTHNSIQYFKDIIKSKKIKFFGI